MPSLQIRFVLEPTPGAVRRARHRVAAAAEAWGVPLDEDLRFRIEVVTSELLTNALRHAPGPTEVEVSLERDLLLVSVHDGSPVMPTACATDGEREGGRGLALVEGLCLLHGADRTADGKRCWAVVPVPAPVDRTPRTPAGAGRAGAGEPTGRWSITPDGLELLKRLLPAVYALEP
ncbi:ATP-binding protein [Streptomyces sp. NPDC052077]|uniref:ATP-binding protein n=1 Tax=Streptomyces sp. NPDC052077 TaxID=3154757 RepID=UPI003437AE6B